MCLAAADLGIYLFCERYVVDVQVLHVFYVFELLEFIKSTPLIPIVYYSGCFQKRAQNLCEGTQNLMG